MLDPVCTQQAPFHDSYNLLCQHRPGVHPMPSWCMLKHSMFKADARSSVEPYESWQGTVAGSGTCTCSLLHWTILARPDLHRHRLGGRRVFGVDQHLHQGLPEGRLARLCRAQLQANALHAEAYHRHSVPLHSRCMCNPVLIKVEAMLLAVAQWWLYKEYPLYGQARCATPCWRSPEAGVIIKTAAQDEAIIGDRSAVLSQSRLVSAGEQSAAPLRPPCRHCWAGLQRRACPRWASHGIWPA